MRKCCVIGLGYIGLPTSAILADSGYEVIGVDVNQKIIAKVNNGEVHITEPNLEAKVQKAVKNKLLIAQDNISSCDVFIIAVPTPFYKNDNDEIFPNIEYVTKAAIEISKVISKGNLVLLESTSPVGTTEKISSLISKHSGLSQDSFLVAFCPERVLPGKILQELVNNDRVVGGLSESASKAAKEFYSSFCKGKIFITNAKTAELVKLAENSYRDVNIAFANELSIICKNMNINVNDLIKLTNRHPRVNILKPGCGVGGHCIAVDPWFIISAEPEASNLIKTARIVNQNKTNWVISQIILKVSEMEKVLSKDIKIGCFGITFKPDVEDLRESPAFLIVKELLERGYDCLICEPNLKEHNSLKIYSEGFVIENSDILIFLVAHTKFKNIDTKSKKVLDFCGLD